MSTWRYRSWHIVLCLLVIGAVSVIRSFMISVHPQLRVDDERQEKNNLRRFGRVLHPWLGIAYEMADGKTSHGALVATQDDAIVPDSPAAKAGVRPGDIIVAVDERTIDGVWTLARAISLYLPGDTVTLHVLRRGKPLLLEATVREPPPSL